MAQSVQIPKRMPRCSGHIFKDYECVPEYDQSVLELLMQNPTIDGLEEPPSVEEILAATNILGPILFTFFIAAVLRGELISIVCSSTKLVVCCTFNLRQQKS